MLSLNRSCSGTLTDFWRLDDFIVPSELNSENSSRPIAENLELLRQKLEAALALYKSGDFGSSSQMYRAILEEIPDQPDALHMLGMIAQRMGKTELALRLFDETVKIVPNFAQGWSNRAVLLRALGRGDEALRSGQRAISCDPNLADGWDITGLLLREKHQFQAAAEHHERAMALKPDHSGLHNNYAVDLVSLGRLEEAYKVALRAAELDPYSAAAPLSVGNILVSVGYPDRAIAYFRKAFELKPDLYEARVNEGRAHLLIGNFEKGWELMEFRADRTNRFAGIPRWDGRPIEHLLVYDEQGMGDTIQFIRYIALLSGYAKKITIQVQNPLRRLVAENFPQAFVITSDHLLPNVDAHISFLSLPHIFKTRLENVPCSVPYLRATEEWRAPWKERLTTIPKPRIGIVWAGNPLHRNDHNRSVQLKEMTPLLQSARPHLVSLQKKMVTRDIPEGVFDADYGAPDKNDSDAAGWLNDFASTAGLITELDLVISVDTSVAHLAGALGKPTWVLLPFDLDWRWLLGREDSPWYPNMRLFRQPAPTDWASVIKMVAQDVERFIAGEQSVLQVTPWTGGVLQQQPNALPGY